MVRSDVVIVGGGPAALAGAVACAERGLRVAVLAGPRAPWVPLYGGWVDELQDAGLGLALGPSWPDALVAFDDHDVRPLGRAYARVDKDALRSHLLARCDALGVAVRWERAVGVDHAPAGSRVQAEAGEHHAAVVVDASGHRPVFVRRAGEPTAFQAAVGAHVPAGGPWDPHRMTFMDLRTDHVDDDLGAAAPTFLYAMPLGDRVFVEETSLVRAPAVPVAVLRRRLARRLERLGVAADALQVDEVCLIPMDTPLPDLSQRVVGLGAAASMVHPASGYLLPRVFAAAPRLAAALGEGLGAGQAPAQVARSAWRAVWTDADLLRRRLHLFGSGILASLSADEQRRFFDGFFAMPRPTWSGYLAGSGDVAGVLRAMTSMLVHSSPPVRWKLLRSGTRLPHALLGAAV